MTELELYKFITDNSIEWSRRENEGTPDILIFPYTFQMDDFCKLAKGYLSDDGGFEMTLMNGYFAIWMKDFCEYKGVDIDKVFIDEEK